MATLYENLNTGDDAQAYCDSSRYDAQIFTVGAIGHTVTSVKLKLYRAAGFAATVTAAIHGVDGSDLPDDGNVLATSNAVPAASISSSSPGSFVEFTFSSPPELSPTTLYAVVLKPGADINDIQWRYDSENGYADGEFALRSGGTWGTSSGNDGMFEIWGAGIGIGAVDEGIKTATVVTTVSLTSESYVSQQGFPTDRPSDLDPDLYWDEENGVWSSTRTTIPGNWVQQVLAISEEGDIYFRTL